MSASEDRRFCLSQEGVINMATMHEKAEIMNKKEIGRALKRIAHEVLEKNHERIDDILLVGIQRRGVPLARQLQMEIKAVEGKEIPMGVLDITMYRDDLSLLNAHPVLNSTDIPFVVDGKVLILVDDVFYTGRTARAAMDALIDMGRPDKIQLVALVDRGHRELPIRADYVGKNVPTSKEEVVHVLLPEIDGDERVILVERD